MPFNPVTVLLKGMPVHAVHDSRKVESAVAEYNKRVAR
jgi:hypothetical protein